MLKTVNFLYADDTVIYKTMQKWKSCDTLRKPNSSISRTIGTLTAFEQNNICQINNIDLQFPNTFK